MIHESPLLSPTVTTYSAVLSLHIIASSTFGNNDVETLIVTFRLIQNDWWFESTNGAVWHVDNIQMFHTCNLWEWIVLHFEDETLLCFVHEHLFTGASALMVTCVYGELKYPLLIGKWEVKRCRAHLILFSTAVRVYVGFILLDIIKIVLLVYACEVLNKLVYLITSDCQIMLHNWHSFLSMLYTCWLSVSIVCNMFISYFVETLWEKGPKGEWKI